MRPDDKSPSLPVAERPFRVLIISGSNRRQYNCPGVDSKSRMLMLRMAEHLPNNWEIDYEDLGNIYGRARIQSCNACVSTSMALCVWPCNCYKKGDKKEPDLMWNLDLYARLDAADAWAIIGPVNWYSPSSNLKLLFDRLVCMNGGNPNEELIDHKDPEKAMLLEHSLEWVDLSVNHLEGRTAAFFCYGDAGGDELDAWGRPKILQQKHLFNPAEEPYENDRLAYQSLVWQCRYGGIEVPDNLWQYQLFGKGKKYSHTQAEDMVKDEVTMTAFDDWTERFASFVQLKGKVPPGKYRAFNYQPPAHFWNEMKNGWRHFRLMMQQPPKGSSPEVQQQQELNREPFTLNYQKSEGEKLRS